jgi:hypothetical protein
MRLRISLRGLLVGLLLIAVSSPAVKAQDSISPAKHAAIKKLIEVSGMQRYMAAIFEEMVSRNQAGWPEGVIAGFKAKGLFKPLSAADAAKMEKLIYEFSDNVFGEIKRRVATEIITTENLEGLVAQTYDKYFTEDEINTLAAFCQTQAGKKFLDEYAKVLSKAIIATLQAKGAFTTLPSADAELAKAERLKKEIENNPAALIRQVSAGMEIISPDHFTEAEIRELSAFSKTPVGRKLATISPAFLTEIMAHNSRVFAPLVGKLSGEVFGEQMEVFERRTKEILKNYDSQGRRRSPAHGLMPRL